MILGGNLSTTGEAYFFGFAFDGESSGMLFQPSRLLYAGNEALFHVFTKAL